VRLTKPAGCPCCCVAAVAPALHCSCVQALLPSLPHLAHLNLYKNWEFGDEQLVKCCVHMLGLVSLDLRGTIVTGAHKSAWLHYFGSTT
jgi:hypothetical protein